MAAIMEYKLDEAANAIIWLFRKNGKTRVMLETGGVWKTPEDVKDALLDSNPHVLFNSQTDLTEDVLGGEVLAAWQAAGSPTIEKTGEPTEEYCNKMPWAPASVLACYGYEFCVLSVPEKGRCWEFATHEDADGNQFCDGHWSQEQQP